MAGGTRRKHKNMPDPIKNMERDQINGGSEQLENDEGPNASTYLTPDKKRQKTHHLLPPQSLAIVTEVPETLLMPTVPTVTAPHIHHVHHQLPPHVHHHAHNCPKA